MKLATMPDEQKSQWIAEKLGYRFETRILRLFANEEDEAPTPQEYGPCWWMPGKDSCSCPQPDMINDPAMTLLLMEQMNIDTIHRFKIHALGHPIWHVSVENWQAVGVIGQAVADVFMLVSGWEDE